MFVRLEFLGDVPLGVDECLFADPFCGNLLFVGVADFEIVAEDVVVADLEALDAGSFYLALLDLEEVVFSVGLNSAQLVQLGVHTTGDDVWSSLCQRRVGNYLALYTCAHLCAGVELFAEKGEIGVIACFFTDPFDGCDSA